MPSRIACLCPLLLATALWLVSVAVHAAPAASYTSAQPPAVPTAAPPPAAKPSAAPSAAPAAPLAVQDETFALWEGLIRELRKGGFVLYLRHGPVMDGIADQRTKGEWWKNCATTQRLAPAAQPQAVAIGQALSRQRVQIADVQASEYCRAYDMAVLLSLAPPLRTPLLNAVGTEVSGAPAARPKGKPAAPEATAFAGIKTLLGTMPAPGKNTVLVGHGLPPGAPFPVLSVLPEGHTAIFKPEGNGRFHFVATLSPGQWQWVGKMNVLDNVPPVPPPPPPPPPPAIDPAKELKGAALLDALRRGGLNLYMRHAQSNVGQDQDLQKTPMWWDNCAIQRNISDTGRDQARKVGAALRDLKIPIANVKASQFCRVRETATLMGLGSIEITEDLNHQIGQRAGFDVNVARFKQLATVPPKGKNTMLVSHTHGSPRNEERVMGSIQEAEVVVYQPDGKGGAEPIARVPLQGWDALLQLANQTK